MQIQVNTDNFIHGDERVIEVAEAAVETDLGRFADRLTRVEVHLKDQNADKHGPAHIHCTMEARPKGGRPLAATDEAEDIQKALKGAATKLRGRLDRELGKTDSHR